MIVQLRKSKPHLGNAGDVVEVDETMGSHLICSGHAIHAERQAKPKPKREFKHDKDIDKG